MTVSYVVEYETPVWYKSLRGRGSFATVNGNEALRHHYSRSLFDCVQPVNRHLFRGDNSHSVAAFVLIKTEDQFSYRSAGLPAGWNTPSNRTLAVPVFSRE